IILIKLIRVSLGTVRHPRRFKIVVIDIQITLKQMLRDFIGIRVNRAKKSGMVNITSSVNSRERRGIKTILHELNPLFTINVTMRAIITYKTHFRVNIRLSAEGTKFWHGVAEESKPIGGQKLSHFDVIDNSSLGHLE